MARTYELGDNFAAIGMAFEDDDELAILLERTLTGGRAIYTDTGRYVVASDGNGAELWFVLDQADEIISVDPYFRGKGAVRTRITQAEHDASGLGMTMTVHGWADPVPVSSDPLELQGQFPYHVDILDWAVIANRAMPFEATLGVTAFPWSLTVHKTEDDFTKAMGEEDLPANTLNFVPLGLLAAGDGEDAPPRAFAGITGRVLESAVFQNPWGQGAYGWALIQSAGGQFDLMLDVSQGLIPPKPGAVVETQAWLAACLAEQET